MRIMIGICLLLLLAACSVEQPKEDLSAEQMMAAMPCHQMPDGTWMGLCDEEVPLEQEVEGLAPAKSSTIVDVGDGETYSISADIIKKTINGNELVMYGYNSMIPGPALRVQQDSKIFVEFTNNIDMPTTVHWHGLRHDIANDGVPEVSQPQVFPGESFTYELYFPDDGIFWYHPHIREDIQQDNGLSGNMLVTPEYSYFAVNREELLVLDDVLLGEDGLIVPFGEEHANFAIMGRFGNTMLINGETTYELSVLQGEVVRFYLTNVANVRPYNFSIPGATMKLIGGDLGLYEHESFVDSVVIAPAQRYIIDVFFEESGEYGLMNINPHKEYVLGTVTVLEEHVATSYAKNFSVEHTNQRVVNDIASFEEYFDKEVDYELELTINMEGMMEMMSSMPCHVMGGIVMGDCTDEEREELEEEHEEMSMEWEDEMNMMASASMIEWIIEDTSTTEQNMNIGMTAKVGDVIKIRLFNNPDSMHPMQHPIHLHGQRFITTHIDGQPVDNKVWMDTVLVPIGSTVDILVDVTNPGEWMMHCHIAEHLEAGMMTSFEVEV